MVMRKQGSGTDRVQMVGLLVEGCDSFRVREAVVFRNGRGERRVSWLAHRAELVVLRRNAERCGGSVSSQVRGWWLDGLPMLVDSGVLLDDLGGWTVYVHHLPRFLPRERGTPRGQWVEWPLPDGVLDLEEASSPG